MTSLKPTPANMAGLHKPQERGDCTVRAVAAAVGVPYGAAYEALAKAGRKPKRGTSMSATLKAARSLGAKLHKVPLVKRQTIKTLAKDLPKGHRYIASMYGHVAGIVDGEAVDWAAETHRIVKALWRVEAS